MQVYRIGQTKYANDRNGSGVDGRWNSAGQYMIYTGGSLALSCLEKLAHTTGTSLYAGNFSVTVYQIPERIKITEITLNQLQKQNAEWYKVLNYPITQAIGDDWLQRRDTAVLKVPSAIIDLEYNFLFNPAHADFTKIKISEVRPFTFDKRLKP
ncbi:RES family NAD+ phosphorylase [Mucilaginibacter ginsenosidivorans]|uniref:RES domain-containing protein n=1 Tax=Mucilaginibacter ginsenosidivorans TaxID=398053 RepID=A0A5B8UWS1_9SPHI|nr:RES family NAD+ phosphorylase [Mucilaginibacter ginsenosidivorans]QEC63348.1 RES domain-containing protein [Mucilaginibacter ginsenosidivorans]